MNIRSVSDSSSILSTRALSSTSSTSAQNVCSSGETGAAPVEMSQGAELLQKLSDLSKSDPDSFKSLMQDAADQLRQAADGKTGKQAEMLQTMADKFDSAAETGDVSDLKPPPPPSGHHNHRVAKAYQDSSSSDSANGSDSVRATLDSVFQQLRSAVAGVSSGSEASAAA